MFLFKRKKNKRIAERKTETPFYNYLSWKPIIVGVLLWLITMILFFNDDFTASVDLTETQKAPKTILSSVSFECINIKLTQVEKDKALEKIIPIFNINNSAKVSALERVNSLVERLKKYYDSSNEQKKEINQSINDLIIGSTLEAEEIVNSLSRNTLRNFEQKLINEIENIYSIGVISKEDLEAFSRKNDKLEIFYEQKLTYEIHDIRNLLTKESALAQLTKEFPNKLQNKVITKLYPILISSSLEFNQDMTNKKIEDSIATISPILNQFPKDFVLVKENEVVTKQTIELLKAHEEQLSLESDPAEQRLRMLGKGILLLAALIATTVMLKLVNPEIMLSTEKLILLSVLSLITLGSARLLSYLSIHTEIISSSVLIYLIPHALAVLLGTILISGGAALSVGFWGSLATAVYFDESFSVFVLGIFTTVAATTAARNMHRRSNLYRAGLLIAIVNIIFTLIIYIFDQPELSILAKQLIGAFLSAVISTILTLLLVPLFEKIFGITTDITLLELSDMGHPLLQKMAIQAPGTYHHSLMVATLSQNAAESIGANSLMVRVCAYYHDIGKMAKPDFFAENIQENNNPHDSLSPHMSALVIIAHVKEGLALAKRHKLPTPILEAIEQHHGNSLIYYFYNKAKKQLSEKNSDIKINDSDFRYGGQLPVSPEMAILSLADASEAASRSMEKPTPQKISNLIEEIFETKLSDGQLDEAKLTMGQINIIKESIIFSLSNMLHARLSYKNDEDSSNKSTKNISSKTSED